MEATGNSELDTLKSKASGLREELLKIDGERKKIEEEIEMLMEVLTAPGQPGMKEPLVDEEDFPRNDIDVTSKDYLY